MQDPKQLDSGFSTLALVIVVAGVTGLVGGFNALKSQMVLKSSDVRNAGQEVDDLNYNAFSVYQALGAGKTPAIYPDPYLPINQAQMVVSSSAVPNKLWKGTTDSVTIYSTSFHGNPKGKETSTNVRSSGFSAKDAARPYLITHANVKAESSVQMALLKTKKNLVAKASVEVGPPPTPECKIGFTGTPSMQPFNCVKTPAQIIPVMDPASGRQAVDPATGAPLTVTKPAVYQSCPGMARGWAFDTDEGQPVTAHFFGSGVVVDAQVSQAPGLEGPLNFAAGPLPKASAAIPFPGAHRVTAVDASLRDISFVAMNSQWIELKVAGPDGTVGSCVAGLHVNHGADSNTPTDSWGEDTLVQLADGTFKKISALKYGDLVWNPRYKEATPVLYLHETASPSAMVEIKLGSKSIHVTSQHPLISRRGVVFANQLRVGDQLAGADEAWKTVSGTRVYRPEPGFKVYDVFLRSKRAPSERLLNVDGLLSPSYEWQAEFAPLPSLTLFDYPQIPAAF